MAGAWTRGGIVRIAAATGAVLIGCILLLQAGAPLRMPLMNAAALLVGLALLGLLGAMRRLGGLAADAGLLAASVAVPLTALLGPSADGVSRWLIVGGITVQPALMVGPLLVLCLVQRPTMARAIAVAIAAAGVALQADPAAAAMLFFGTAAGVVAGRRAMPALAALSFAAAALVIAAATAPTLPPVPFVEGVIANAFRSGPLAGALALASLALLFAPAIVRGRGDELACTVAFAATWAAAVLASVAGNYPTPVIGYGGSAIVGYLLSVGMLGWSSEAAAAKAGQRPVRRNARSTGGKLRLA